MATTVKLYQTKALGHYALQRGRITDWLRPHRSKSAQRSAIDTAIYTNTRDLDTPLQPEVDSQDAQKLRAVVRESHTILAKAHSVFPMQLFPDRLNIDRHKFTIIHRQFFGVEQTVSVPIENIKNIEADFGPFFGSITVTSDLFINNTQTVHFLWRRDAKMIQKLVQGAVVAQREEIDLNKIDVKQLRTLLIDLGSGHSKSMRK